MGWTSEFIKDLDEGGMDTLTQEMREWELTGRLPGQVCITLITMLAKNDRVERPIGLTIMRTVLGREQNGNCMRPGH